MCQLWRTVVYLENLDLLFVLLIQLDLLSLVVLLCQEVPACSVLQPEQNRDFPATCPVPGAHSEPCLIPGSPFSPLAPAAPSLPSLPGRPLCPGVPGTPGEAGQLRVWGAAPSDPPPRFRCSRSSSRAEKNRLNSAILCPLWGRKGLFILYIILHLISYSHHVLVYHVHL